MVNVQNWSIFSMIGGLRNYAHFWRKQATPTG
jgi:hypothetical protein